MTVLDSRRNGVLMGISSLPGSTGIGTMGKNAYKFVDLLHDAGQTYWQILPICPTGYGDSPYQSFSTFAGNPYFIDFDMLAEQGFLFKLTMKMLTGVVMNILSIMACFMSTEKKCLKFL